MLEFVKQKMWNKKWMIFCLIIGNILIIAVSSCNPMYTDAIQKKAMSMAMSNYILEKNQYPGEVRIDSQINVDGSGTHSDSFFTAKEQVEKIRKNMNLDVVQEVTYYYLPKMDCVTQSTYNGSVAKKKLTIEMIEGVDKHIELVSGELFSKKVGADGTIEAMISQKALVTQKLLIGEVLIFDDIQDDDGNPLKIKISGVFENSSDEDLFWVNDPSSMTSTLLIPEEIFQEKFGDFKNTAYKTRSAWYLLFDYEQIRGSNSKEILKTVKNYKNFFSQSNAYAIQFAFEEILQEQISTSKRVVSTLQVLQVPILILLAAFIFMVSRQILEIEQNDISILKSRGASKRQIIMTYFLQSVIVSGIGIIIGIPMGAFLCQIFGSANAFLEFVQRRALSLRFGWKVFLYAFLSVLISIAAMTIPVMKFADLTIVETKQKRRKHSRVWWQRYFLDFVMLAASLYGLYSFHSQKAALIKGVADGAAMDPLLYLSSSLFILGAGLVSLRVIPLVTKFVFWVNKKHWKPASYASFLQVIRSRRKQYFIMIFLILTIALGIFNAKSARTINTNEENKIRYVNGADVTLMEQWEDSSEDGKNQMQAADSQTTDSQAADSQTADSLESDGQESDRGTEDAKKSDAQTASETKETDVALEADSYVEPDIEKYKTIKGVTNVAKVYVTKEAGVSVEKEDKSVVSQPVMLMGINTKEFGQTAWFEDTTLLPVHWYHYLNAISQNTGAILVSSNFHDKLGYQLGDAIVYNTAAGQSVRGIIYGFVDYWPSFQPTITTTNTDGSQKTEEQFLIVAHLSKLQSVDGVLPYQIWLKMSGSTQAVYDFIEEKGLKLVSFKDTNEELIELKNEPVIQGTNGILTVGFIVVLVLCSVGFLIYWILSIQSRSLQFGIFRAMGMTMKEILHMLVFEQLFITIPALLMGSVIGWVASGLYIPLIQIAYSSSGEVIPLHVVSAGLDQLKMYLVVAVVIGICMGILAYLISKIKITQALKLGED